MVDDVKKRANWGESGPVDKCRLWVTMKAKERWSRGVQEARDGNQQEK